jgi:hypothetical protein
MRRFWKALWASPIDTIGGLLMIAVGIALSGAEGWERVTGNVLAAFGGVLITTSTVIAYTKERLTSDLQTRLELVGTHLGGVSGQIYQAVAYRQRGDYEEGTLLALISYSARELYTLVDDIQRIAGTRFESSDLLATVETLQDLANRFAVLTSRGAETEIEEDELEALRDELLALRSNLTQRETVQTTETLPVDCPECSGVVTVTIGASPGASAMPKCPHCARRFHVHRGGDGSVFSRKWGQAQLAHLRELRLTCPNCPNEIVLRVPEGDDEPKTRWCLNCYSRLVVDVLEGRVTAAFKEEPLQGRIAGEEFGHSLIECPTCRKSARAFAKRDETCFAVCYSDNRLLQADVPQRLPTGEASSS